MVIVASAWLAARHLGRESHVARIIPFYWVFHISILTSCPSCLVWSGLIIIICNAVVVVMLFYLALRFACEFLRPFLGTCSAWGSWSGSLLVDLVYRMAYLLVRVEFYPN